VNEKSRTIDDVEPGQEWGIRQFRPEDAEKVAHLFRSVYGSDYPVRTYIEPERLIEENASGRTISIVVITPRGDVIAHNSLFNSAAHPGTYESGAGVVHNLYRGGKGIFTQMVAYGLEVAAGLPNVDAVFGEPVANHPYSQKMCLRLELVSRALEVDLMPDAAYAKEGSATGRVAAFLDFRTLRKKPQTIYLPGVYEEEIRFLYENLDDQRDLVFAQGEALAREVSDITVQVFDFAAVARVAIRRAGADFVGRMQAIEDDLRNKGVVVIQLWLNLAGTWVDAAVGTLREIGRASCRERVS
jgi:hypothetical protein